MKRPDVSVVILTYNTKALTMACLKSLFLHAPKTHAMEVIVCDNGSTDGTHEGVKAAFPDVRYIDNGKNVGFAAGNNPGIRASSGRYVLLLNSDTEMHEGTLDAMLRFMDAEPKTGLATCKVLLANGRLDPACHRGFPTPWAAFTYISGLERLFPNSRVFSGYHLGYKDLATTHDIDCPSGAFFLVRREAMDEAGLMDEEYFMYGEDIDWAYRIKHAGWEVRYKPEVTILHRKKQSGRSHTDSTLRRQTRLYFFDTMRLFYRKHYRSEYPRIVTCLVEAALSFRIWLLKAWGI